MGGEQQNGQLTSLSLIQRARSNDPQAWAKVTGLYRGLVRYWCRQAGCPDAEIEDVEQEVFAAMSAGLAKFRKDRPGDSFRGWLRAITRNQVLMHHRRNRGRPRSAGGSDALAQMHDLADTLAEPSAAESAEAELAEMSEFYRSAVDLVRGEFEDRTWQMFWRTVIDGRSTAGVAEEFNTTAAAARQAKSRVLRRLKQEVGELLE